MLPNARVPDRDEDREDRECIGEAAMAVAPERRHHPVPMADQDDDGGYNAQQY
jgi:hypothetical protein